MFCLPSVNRVLLSRPIDLKPVSFFGLQAPLSPPWAPSGVLLTYLKSFFFNMVKFNFLLKNVNFSVKNSLPTKVL